jgi:hypothetical protein
LRALWASKDPLFLHETGARVNKHYREFNDFSTICGKKPTFVNPYFRPPQARFLTLHAG